MNYPYEESRELANFIFRGSGKKMEKIAKNLKQVGRKKQATKLALLLLTSPLRYQKYNHDF